MSRTKPKGSRAPMRPKLTPPEAHALLDCVLLLKPGQGIAIERDADLKHTDGSKLHVNWLVAVHDKKRPEAMRVHTSDRLLRALAGAFEDLAERAAAN